MSFVGILLYWLYLLVLCGALINWVKGVKIPSIIHTKYNVHWKLNLWLLFKRFSWYTSSLLWVYKFDWFYVLNALVNTSKAMYFWVLILCLWSHECNTLSCRCYIKLHDSPPKSTAEEDDNMSKLLPSQKKKMRQKQRKAEARAKKVL